MGDDLIRYDLLVQEALRGVVRKVLANAARDGLPGDHYFHVEFLTGAPGVKLSERMRKEFPDRMTIILQHHFWDLDVTDEAVEVGLSFGGVGERVRVPFAALTGFFDESVQFGLRFEIEDAPRRREPQAAPAGKPRAAKPAAEAKDSAAKAAPAKPDAATARSGDKAEKTPSTDKSAGKGESKEEGAKVLSIDAFRKKT